MEQIIARGGALDPASAAARLIDEFGSLGAAIFGTRRRQLRAVGSDKQAMISIAEFRMAMSYVLNERLRAKSVLSNWQSLLDHLHTSMAHRTTEQCRILHLNTKNALIKEDILGEGTVDQAPLYVREVVHRALDLGSAALIIVHNHPSGDPSPSQGDINLTKALINAAKQFGIAIYDHLVIGNQGHASLRSLGLI